jgi:TRAP-type C4-dicarboxylate transport system substrate-binding protein
MNSIRATERQMRKLQKQRHMYDIKMMVLSNPIFKNLSERDQKKIVGLIYKAEMMEMYMRDRQIVRINDSFEDIVEGVARMLDEVDERDRRERDEDDEDFR